MESLPFVILLGWFCAAGSGTPPVHAGVWQPADRVSFCSRALGSSSALLQPRLAAAPQAQAPASKAPSDHGLPRFFRSWSRMAERTQAEQPDWLSPIATTSGRLKDELRFDVWRPISPSGHTDYALGGGKGLEFIVAPRIQLLIGIPSFIEYPHYETRDTFGDMPLMLKFRLASAPRKKGNYLLTLLLKATAPTGSKVLGVHDAVLTPGLAFGKGWKRFDVQSTIGPNLPLGDTAILGRQFLWDTAFQYRAPRKLWPELEVNSTDYLTGKYAGEKQVFLTPGLGFGRAHLWRHVGFSAGLGFQIAVTQFHTYNHQGMISVRFPF